MNILGRWVIFVDVTRGEFERNEQKRGAKNTERSGRGNLLPPLSSLLKSVWPHLSPLTV